MRPLLCSTLLVGACASWPRHANLPEVVEGVPVGEDPRAAVPVIWTALAAEDVDQPPGWDVGALSPGAGVLVSGELVGAGWRDGATPATLTSEVCASSGTRAPIKGDYRGDVDVYGLLVSSGGTLCLSAGVGSEGLGFDLLLFEVDACGVPVRLVEDGRTGEVGGLGAAGPDIRWSAPVDGPASYAVLLAGYAPDDDVSLFPYQLGVALVQGEGSLCPLRPGEVAP